MRYAYLHFLIRKQKLCHFIDVPVDVWSAKQAFKAVSNRPQVIWGIDINPSGAEPGIVQGNKINITTANTHGSEIYRLNVLFVFHGGFEPSPPIAGILILWFNVSPHKILHINLFYTTKCAPAFSISCFSYNHYFDRIEFRCCISLYSSVMVFWNWDNHTTIPVPVQSPWGIYE